MHEADQAQNIDFIDSNNKMCESLSYSFRF